MQTMTSKSAKQLKRCMILSSAYIGLLGGPTGLIFGLYHCKYLVFLINNFSMFSTEALSLNEPSVPSLKSYHRPLFPLPPGLI